MTIEDNEEMLKCSGCGGTWPVSELDNCVCPDCGLVRDGILPPVSERHKIWGITEAERQVVEDIPVILRAFAAEDEEDENE